MDGMLIRELQKLCRERQEKLRQEADLLEMSEADVHVVAEVRAKTQMAHVGKA